MSVVTLIHASQRDIPFIMECERRPDYEALVGRWDADRHRAMMDDSNHRYVIGARDGVNGGFAILRDFEAGTDSLYLKRIAVHDAGQGFGKPFLAALTDWVFANTRFHRFWLEVVAGNPRANHVYKSCGWTEEGVVREAFAQPDGTRGSYLQLSILRSEWQSADSGAEV